MAGLAALMTRKKRDRRRELEQKLHPDSGSMAELTGKEAEEAIKSKAAQETIKKMLNGKELLHQKSKSFDALSQVSYQENDDDTGKGGFSNAYSPIYFGLVLMCIGFVMTFVGLGEKGFKTLELKLVGPILILLGFTCITLKVIQCTFPQLFQYPAFLRRRKLGDKEQSSLMEKGDEIQSPSQTQPSSKSPSVHKKTQPPVPSPRVTLHSSKSKVTRPRSTIPNYIEESSDDDDFDPGRKWNVSNSPSRLSQQPSLSNQPQVHSEQQKNEKNVKKPQSQDPNPKDPMPLDSSESDGQKKAEIVLTPKALLL